MWNRGDQERYCHIMLKKNNWDKAYSHSHVSLCLPSALSLDFKEPSLLCIQAAQWVLVPWPSLSLWWKPKRFSFLAGLHRLSFCFVFFFNQWKFSLFLTSLPPKTRRVQCVMFNQSSDEQWQCSYTSVYFTVFYGLHGCAHWRLIWKHHCTTPCDGMGSNYKHKLIPVV